MPTSDTTRSSGSPLDSKTFEIGPADLYVFTAPMNGTAMIDPAVDDLVVEYVSFDHNEIFSGGNFFPGANSQGESRPSYIAAADCGIFEPVTLADVGFPDSANVVVVNGTEGGDPCMASYVGAPRAIRTQNGVKVRFSLDVEHNRRAIEMPVYATLEDSSGNVYASLDMGIHTFLTGDKVQLNGVLKAPASLSAGDYILKVRMENMKGFVTRSHIVAVR